MAHPGAEMNPQLETFRYDDAIVRRFMVATFVWGLVGMLVGLLIAAQLAMPSINAAPSRMPPPPGTSGSTWRGRTTTSCT